MARLDDESLTTWIRAGVEIDRLGLFPEDKELVYTWMWSALVRMAYPSLPVNPGKNPSVCDKLADHPYTLDCGSREWTALYWRNKITDAEEMIKGHNKLRYAVHSLQTRIATLHRLARHEEIMSQYPEGKQREQRRAKINRDERRDHQRKGKRIYEQELDTVRELVGDERAAEVLHYLNWRKRS